MPCVIVAGDTIVAVNGHFVNMENVDSVLATLTSCKTLELLVKKGHTHTPHSYSPATGASSSSVLLSPPQTPSHGGLVRLVSGGRGAGGALRPRQFRRPHRHPHLLLYVTLDTKEDDPADEVCYGFLHLDVMGLCLNLAQTLVRSFPAPKVCYPFTFNFILKGIRHGRGALKWCT